MLTADPVTHFHTQGYVVIPAMAHAVYCRTVISFAQHALREHAEPIEYEADTHYPGAPESREVEGGQTARRILQAAIRPRKQSFLWCSPIVVLIIHRYSIHVQLALRIF